MNNKTIYWVVGIILGVVFLCCCVFAAILMLGSLRKGPAQLRDAFEMKTGFTVPADAKNIKVSFNETLGRNEAYLYYEVTNQDALTSIQQYCQDQACSLNILSESEKKSLSSELGSITWWNPDKLHDVNAVTHLREGTTTIYLGTTTSRGSTTGIYIATHIKASP